MLLWIMTFLSSYIETEQKNSPWQCFWLASYQASHTVLAVAIFLRIYGLFPLYRKHIRHREYRVCCPINTASFRANTGSVVAFSQLELRLLIGKK